MCSFYPEPVAATLSYLWQAQLQTQGVVLTVDFGGGTLDLSVIRYRRHRASTCCRLPAPAWAATASTS